mmetsp:Transcript_20822/g.63711  ORF Transcript_20822/g.63711 Transcript_20822/m.63711 type:complete len:126 (+) Transcript_20822:1505-1882(+)
MPTAAVIVDAERGGGGGDSGCSGLSPLGESTSRGTGDILREFMREGPRELGPELPEPAAPFDDELAAPTWAHSEGVTAAEGLSDSACVEVEIPDDVFGLRTGFGNRRLRDEPVDPFAVGAVPSAS